MAQTFSQWWESWQRLGEPVPSRDDCQAAWDAAVEASAAACKERSKASGEMGMGSGYDTGSHYARETRAKLFSQSSESTWCAIAVNALKSGRTGEAKS